MVAAGCIVTPLATIVAKKIVSDSIYIYKGIDVDNLTEDEYNKIIKEREKDKNMKCKIAEGLTVAVTSLIIAIGAAAVVKNGFDKYEQQNQDSSFLLLGLIIT